jgi:hypothetical protein
MMGDESLAGIPVSPFFSSASVWLFKMFLSVNKCICRSPDFKQYFNMGLFCTQKYGLIVKKMLK